MFELALLLEVVFPMTNSSQKFYLLHEEVTGESNHCGHNTFTAQNGPETDLWEAFGW